MRPEWRIEYGKSLPRGSLLEGIYYDDHGIVHILPKSELRKPVGLDKDKTSQKVGTSSAEEIDFLDVPTFMRKQVD